MHDVVRLPDHFRVSCIAMLYRLRALKLLSRIDHKRLLDEDNAGVARTLRRVLDLPEPDHAVERTRFRSRFLGLQSKPSRVGRSHRPSSMNLELWLTFHI